MDLPCQAAAGKGPGAIERQAPGFGGGFDATFEVDFRAGLWDQGVFPHFCDTRESLPLYGGLVFGKPFLLYHRSGHSPQPCFREIGVFRGDSLQI